MFIAVCCQAALVVGMRANRLKSSLGMPNLERASSYCDEKATGDEQSEEQEMVGVSRAP